MSSWLIVMLLLGLFISLYAVLRSFIAMSVEQQLRAARLRYKQRQGLLEQADVVLQRWGKLYRHLSDLLESLRAPLVPTSFMLLSSLLAVAGIVTGALLFQSAKGTLMLGAVAGLMPYVVFRTALLQRQLQTRIEFLPAVELFYQCYLVTGERQIRHALQRTVEEKRLPAPMQAVFEQLYRNLSVRGDDEASLRVFAAALGHVWGNYFVNILRVALSEGNPISDNLRELLTDMRRARRSNEQERSKLLEIRIANFTPILFLFLFVGINLHYNPESAYRYYVLDPQGRDLVLNSLVLIFGSFVMGIWLSRRKM
ncbi:type II secretion system F family protein [Paenibacillus sp. MMS18-CY102]|uniref:type II secretion system F family protein n=1 Tax=Paenibacillus sp. MMS18-CY102 TaxID=2682849 RepID=UPI0013656562|nr:type II secretion system F family protein [Paenibacillus sp. MMS18-CY102]MWC30678.1 hypothetical protein [Paenibacillus sp. MMS18-CY102]